MRFRFYQESTLEEARSFLAQGMQVLVHVRQAPEINVLDYALLSNESVVSCYDDIENIATLLLDSNIHILPYLPNIGEVSLSSRAIAFSRTHLRGVKDQILIVDDCFDGSPHQIEILNELTQNNLLGIMGPNIVSWRNEMVFQLTRPLRGPSETGISVVTFDLDGVLVESKELHFEAFIKALMFVDAQFAMTKEEHDQAYCGLSTKQKLNKLSEEAGFPREKHDDVWRKKQEYTVSLVNQVVKKDSRLRNVLQTLSDAGYPIAVASNCIRDSVNSLLEAIGIKDLVLFTVSNEDVSSPKPEPEIYTVVVEHFGISPMQMLVIEDSSHGKQAAVMSGANLCTVKNPGEVTVSRLTESLYSSILKPEILNIIIPMGGEESMLFPGSNTPKFLLESGGKTLLQHFVDNVRPNIPHRFIFIARKYQVKRYGLRRICAQACNFSPVVLCEMLERSKSSIETLSMNSSTIPLTERVLIVNMNSFPIFFGWHD
jgi:HAD superfamily hydrolase (TIGR01509 family)